MSNSEQFGVAGFASISPDAGCGLFCGSRVWRCFRQRLCPHAVCREMPSVVGSTHACGHRTELALVCRVRNGLAMTHPIDTGGRASKVSLESDIERCRALSNQDTGDLRERIVSACHCAASYLEGRQSPGGGFCFYRTDYLDEPNLCDTFHAVSALTRLGRSMPQHERVREFLGPFCASHQPGILFHLISALRILQPDADVPDRVGAAIDALSVTPLPPPGRQVTGWLERTRLVARLKHLSGDERAVRCAASLVARLRNGGGFGVAPNVTDTWLALDVLAVYGDDHLQAGDIRAFIDAVQKGPAGFTCCRLLDLRIHHRDHVLRFLCGCQASSGGFAPSPGALPNIELTDRGLAAIFALHCRDQQASFGRRAERPSRGQTRDGFPRGRSLHNLN